VESPWHKPGAGEVVQGSAFHFTARLDTAAVAGASSATNNLQVKS
jgi:hypothetical protein